MLTHASYETDPTLRQERRCRRWAVVTVTIPGPPFGSIIWSIHTISNVSIVSA